MKLKLKVSKDTKRRLKKKAETLDQTRNDYVLSAFLNHIEDNTDKWQGTIDTYAQEYQQKMTTYKELLEANSQDETLTYDEKRQAEYNFCKDHLIFLYKKPKKGQMENLMIHIEERAFYKLCILADFNHLSVENYCEKIIHYYK